MVVTGLNATSLPQKNVWRSPKLKVLGDIGSLTESGSMAQQESPQNLCILCDNMVGNSCMA